MVLSRQPGGVQEWAAELARRPGRARRAERTTRPRPCASSSPAADETRSPAGLCTARLRSAPWTSVVAGRRSLGEHDRTGPDAGQARAIPPARPDRRGRHGGCLPGPRPRTSRTVAVKVLRSSGGRGPERPAAARPRGRDDAPGAQPVRGRGDRRRRRREHPVHRDPVRARPDPGRRGAPRTARCAPRRWPGWPAGWPRPWSRCTRPGWSTATSSRAT